MRLRTVRVTPANTDRDVDVVEGVGRVIVGADGVLRLHSSSVYWAADDVLAAYPLVGVFKWTWDE